MITLPEFIIEKCNDKWTVYSTEECVTFEFSTREEAEQALKTLKTN